MKLVQSLRALFLPSPEAKAQQSNEIQKKVGNLDVTKTFSLSSHPWVATHRHRKGGLYRVLGQGILEADRSEAIIYQDKDGTIWIRPTLEFEDGRFERLAD